MDLTLEYILVVYESVCKRQRESEVRNTALLKGIDKIHPGIALMSSVMNINGTEQSVLHSPVIESSGHGLRG